MSIRSVASLYMDAHRSGGKPVGRQLAESIRLRLGSRRIGLSEYHDYGLWHTSVTAEELDRFIGYRTSAALDEALNAQGSRILANDKLVNYLVLHALGFPIPQPIATYSRYGRRIGPEPALRSLDEVRALLHDGASYPFYVKPISAGYGRGVLGVESRRGADLLLMDGNTIGIDAFLAPFDRRQYNGMLFQRPLRAHPAIAALTGTHAISCVRFICLVEDGARTVHTAFWKITTGRNMLDNFSHGDFGNCLAALDVQTGRVTRAIARMGPGGAIERHPTTGAMLTGFDLPDWQAAVDLVMSASIHFPGLRLQNWDVAMCEGGPVLVELNTESELAVPQAISGRGILDPRMKRALGG